MTNENTTTDLTMIIDALTAPFAANAVEIKPGAVAEETGRALALAYVDWREYADRLDAVVGPANWSIALQPWGDTRIIATLTILGVSKSATGEGTPNDENCGTSAEAQAKKRACAEFGLGRYLYRLPDLWAPGKGTKKHFRFDDPQGIVRQIYAKAGLPVTADPPAPIAVKPAGTSPPPAQIDRARATLRDAEQRTGTRPYATRTRNASADEVATEPQIGRIATLLASRPNGPERDRIGKQVNLDLHDIQEKDDVRTLGLTKRQASRLITCLAADELVV